jgi:hypothetical protein
MTDPILSCVNLFAVMVWSFSTDRFGRRIIINTCQTAVCVILFIVGALYYTNATNGNGKAATALLVISCLWTFMVQIIIMSYYIFSAELPSALLRSKSFLLCGISSFSFLSLTFYSQDRAGDFLRKLNHGYRLLVCPRNSSLWAEISG